MGATSVDPGAVNGALSTLGVVFFDTGAVRDEPPCGISNDAPDVVSDGGNWVA